MVVFVGWMLSSRRWCRVALPLALLVAAVPAMAQQELGRVRVGLQAGGTLSWVTFVIQRLGLDQARGIRVETTTYATKQATEIALRAGEADVVVDDFVGVTTMRAAGVPVRAVYPFSLATGGVVVPVDSPIRTVADLQGKRIAVASLDDKSWLILRALGVARYGVDLQRASEVQAAAPPLMTELLGRGDIDAAIPYWHFVARLVGTGRYRELISVSRMLAELNLPTDLPILVIVARDGFIEANPAAAQAFLGALREAWARMSYDSTLWGAILDANLYRLDDRSLLPSIRQRFVEGIPRGWDEATIAGLVNLVDALVDVAGPELVGAAGIDPQAFTTVLARAPRQ